MILPPGTGAQTCLAILQRRGSQHIWEPVNGKAAPTPRGVSWSHVHKTTLQETDGRGKVRCGLCIWSPATVAVAAWPSWASSRPSPKPSWENGHTPGQTEQLRERSHVAAEWRRRKAMPGSRHEPPSSSGGQTLTGLRLRGDSPRDHVHPLE